MIHPTSFMPNIFLLGVLSEYGFLQCFDQYSYLSDRAIDSIIFF